MIFSYLRTGFKGAWRNLLLTLVSWIVRILILVPFGVGFAIWPSDPKKIAALLDMLQHSHDLSWALFASPVFAAAALALVGNAVLSGGMLRVLINDNADRSSFWRPFFLGARHFFWRNLLILLPTFLAGGVAMYVTSTVLTAALAPFDDSFSLLVDWISLFMPFVVGFVVALFFFVFVLDYARIELVRSDDKNVFKAWWIGLRFAMRRFWTTLFIWLIVGLVALALAGAPSVLLPLLVGPQLALLIASWLRIVVLAAEIDLFVKNGSL